MKTKSFLHYSPCSFLTAVESVLYFDHTALSFQDVALVHHIYSGLSYVSSANWTVFRTVSWQPEH